jgi:hypothetical protein
MQETIANRNYKFNHLKNSVIQDMAKLKSTHYEAMLTRGLGTIIGSDVNARTLTTQERYAILLTYLDAIEDKNIDQSINIKQFLHSDLSVFKRDWIKGDNIQVRHLTGIEAEALEIGCENTADWILGAMCMQIGCDELPPIQADLLKDIGYTGQMIKNRLDTLNELDQPILNDLIYKFRNLDQELHTLVNISYYKGIVLNKINGGTDDAPVRFRINSAITGPAKQLFAIVVEENSTV